MSQTVALLGGSGMLGTDLDICLQSQGYQTRLYDLPEFDLTDPDQVRDVVSTADAVINCAAYTNVDGAESNEAMAMAVNAEAVGCLGQLARKAGCWVLHLSTDFIFDGKLDRPYSENDEPNPISVYGRSKLEGERALAASDCPHALVRIEWTYGLHGTNFIQKLLERARNQGVLTVVDDQIGSPTATVEVAQVLADLLGRRATGIYHCASSGYVSRFEMARHVVDSLGLDVTVSPCKTNEFNSPAARPLNSRFNCDKLTHLMGRPMVSWQEMLKTYLEQL